MHPSCYINNLQKEWMSGHNPLSYVHYTIELLSTLSGSLTQIWRTPIILYKYIYACKYVYDLKCDTT